MSDKERPEDLKGGPGHIVLLAVVFAVPVLKLAWTLGGGGEASEALVAMEPSNWPDVLIGMLLNNALLASVLAVVVSRTSYAYFAAKGGARAHADTPSPTCWCRPSSSRSPSPWSSGPSTGCGGASRWPWSRTRCVSG
ncbi:hypothetical protein [Streptomyces pulveraceus]|uniref:Uncharacterized protein n=1 Tax=Streptomyces pulveraceus TaxID=68258 RepID=A0ABW1GN40_9ACTN